MSDAEMAMMADTRDDLNFLMESYTMEFMDIGDALEEIYDSMALDRIGYGPDNYDSEAF